MICENCEMEYNKQDRKGKPGRLTLCNQCAEEEGDVIKVTGNMIYSHKTCPDLQINKDPKLTDYIAGRTEGDSEHSSDMCVKEAETFHYKS